MAYLGGSLRPAVDCNRQMMMINSDALKRVLITVGSMTERLGSARVAGVDPRTERLFLCLACN